MIDTGKEFLVAPLVSGLGCKWSVGINWPDAACRDVRFRGQALQSHSSFKQIPIDLYVGSQDLTSLTSS